MKQTKQSIKIEAGPIKIQGADSVVTYIALVGLIGLVSLYIYAKYLHHKVVRRIRKKK